MNFQLTPAEYNRSQLLAHFIRYLFYDVYTKYAGDDFMKRYGPRMFHFIGSTGYSPTTGTEVLGTASGGVKITLYNVNEIKPWSETVAYDDNDIEVLNERIFHTMHHEFSHILHQTKSYPITFGQVTSGSYDPIDWHERDSLTTHQLGYVTHYASSANYEDFVETLSCTITDTDARWMNRIINACCPGLRAGDKERVYELIDSLDINVDAAQAHWNNFTIYTEEEYDETTRVSMRLQTASHWTCSVALSRWSTRKRQLMSTSIATPSCRVSPLSATSSHGYLIKLMRIWLA